MKKKTLSVFCAASTSSTSGNRTEYPLTVTTCDYSQNPVQETYDKAPERVWVQNQNNIEIMLKLGLADKIVGACGPS